MEAKPRLPDAQVNIPREHPLQEAGLLAIAGAVLAGFSTLVVLFFVEIIVWALPPRIEAAWLSTEELLPQQVLAQDDATTQQLQGLLDELAQHWPNNPYDLHLRVIDAEEENAFAVPGGLILVTSGLIAEATSENELAFVLAHEIGHFRNRDHLRGLGRKALLSVLLAGAGVYGNSSLLDVTSGLLELRFGRGQEEAADRVALSLLQQHYGHVGHSWDFLRRAVDEAGLEEVIPTFLRTHPASAARVAALRQLAEQRGYAVSGAVRPWPSDN